MQVRSLGREESLDGGGHDDPLQHSCLGNPKDRGAWWATVHGIPKTWTERAHTHTHRHTHRLEDMPDAIKGSAFPRLTGNSGISGDGVGSLLVLPPPLCPRRACLALAPVQAPGSPTPSTHTHTHTHTPAPDPLLLCSCPTAYTFLSRNCWPVGRGRRGSGPRAPQGRPSQGFRSQKPGRGLALLPSFHHILLSSETTAGSFPGPGLWCQPPCCAAHPGQAATPQQRAEGPFGGTAQRTSPTPTPPGAPHPPGPVAQGLAQPIRSLGPPRQQPSQSPRQASPCPSLACELVRPTFCLKDFPPA